MLAQPLINRILTNTAVSLCWESAYWLVLVKCFQFWIHLPHPQHPWGTFCFSFLTALHLVKAVKSKAGCEVAWLPESWDSKVMAMSPFGTQNQKRLCWQGQQLFTWLTDLPRLGFDQYTADWWTEPSISWLILDLQVPIRTCKIILEKIMLDSFSYVFETCKAKYIGIESNAVLQVCTYPSAGKNVVPDLRHAFECCWDTCDQTFNSWQRYFDHVETHVYCNPRGRKVEGGVPCRWRGE
jgi:hypothetical protein